MRKRKKVFIIMEKLQARQVTNHGQYKVRDKSSFGQAGQYIRPQTVKEEKGISIQLNDHMIT